MQAMQGQFPQTASA
jgi:hypothetical protein